MATTPIRTDTMLQQLERELDEQSDRSHESEKQHRRSMYSRDADRSFASLADMRQPDATLQSQLEQLLVSPSPSPARSKSSMLSISSLFPDNTTYVNDTTASTIKMDEVLQSPRKRPVRTQDIVSDACADIARELEAVETRLALYRHARPKKEQQQDESPRYGNARDSASGIARKDPISSPHTASRRSSSSDRQQQAGEVADEVESALLNCERLLSRAKASVINSPYLSRSAVSSRASTSISAAASSRATMKELEQSTPIGGEARPEPAAEHSMRDPPATPSTYIPVKTAPSPPPVAASSNTHTPPTNAFDPPSPDEHELEAKAIAMKAFAARCQREMEEAAGTAQQQQNSLQTTFLKELQRKYESKKKMSILALKEKYERETKSLVRSTMEKYEQEQTQMLSRLEDELVKDRERTMNDIIMKQEKVLEDRVKRVEARLSAETLSRKKLLESRFQAELDQKLQAIEVDSEEAIRNWEIQKRLDLEHEVFKRREQAAVSILREQELKTSALKREIEQKHADNEEAELEKLKKALAFGAQAQVQQLRKKLESEHEDRISEAKANAARSLESKLLEVKQMLQHVHQDEQDKLTRELHKRHQIAVIEQQESLQAAQHAQIQEIKLKADREKEAALAACRSEASQEHQRQLQDLEQTLEMELRVKSHQMEIEQEASYNQLLDDLRDKLIQTHQRELDARVARMEQSRSILLSEAKTYLSMERHPADHGSATRPSEASQHLHQLKRHVSNELAKYVEILATDFDDMTEEQRILVVKITDLTQLYLTFKRQCGKLETQSTELKSALQTLHLQLQNKELMCKKLYQANEALLQRLQVPPPVSPKKSSRR